MTVPLMAHQGALWLHQSAMLPADQTGGLIPQVQAGVARHFRPAPGNDRGRLLESRHPISSWKQLCSCRGSCSPSRSVEYLQASTLTEALEAQNRPERQICLLVLDLADDLFRLAAPGLAADSSVAEGIN